MTGRRAILRRRAILPGRWRPILVIPRVRGLRRTGRRWHVLIAWRRRARPGISGRTPRGRTGVLIIAAGGILGAGRYRLDNKSHGRKGRQNCGDLGNSPVIHRFVLSLAPTAIAGCSIGAAHLWARQTEPAVNAVRWGQSVAIADRGSLLDETGRNDRRQTGRLGARIVRGSDGRPLITRRWVTRFADTDAASARIHPFQ